MKRGRISISVFLCFLMMMFLVVMGCGSKDDALPAAATTYSIAGTVTGAASVVINLTTGASTTGSVTTGASGVAYSSFTGLANGTYTVTPVLTGYTFEPGSRVVVVNGSNIAGIDFTATAGTGHTIFGTVSGVGVSGVKITFSAGSPSVTIAEVLTVTGGTYTSPSLQDDTYTVTPYHSGYFFTPDSITVILSADSTGNDFDSAAANFTQADLVGTWDARSLEGGNQNGWSRVTATVDPDGLVAFSVCLDSAGNTACPTVTPTIVWTIDETTGVITETGTGSNVDNHYTMASNKKFIAGTQHGIGTTHPAIMIAQQKDPLTVYATSNLSGAFVYHQMFTSTRTGAQGWSYGAGSIASGVATISSETNSWGDPFTPGGGGTLTVASNGIVTMTGDPNWQGFLSVDKRTIVGVSTYARDGGTDYTLMVIQATSGQSSSISQVAGTSRAHMLAAGADKDLADTFWGHQTITTTAGGVMSFSNWVTSGSESGGSGSPVMLISSSGTATVAGAPFHGQLSYDGTFMVGVETFDTGVFALDVFTK